MQISTPVGSALPPNLPVGTTVTVARSSGFTYSYTVGNGYYDTVVEPDTATVNTIGIGFFHDELPCSSTSRPAPKAAIMGCHQTGGSHDAGLR